MTTITPHACCGAVLYGLLEGTHKHQSAVTFWTPWSHVDTDTMVPVSPLNATETHVEVAALADQITTCDVCGALGAHGGVCFECEATDQALRQLSPLAASLLDAIRH